MPEDAADGTAVLPAAIGPVSRYNAEGRYDVHRDQPMETAYRQAEWHWTEWHGPYEVEKTGIVDVPYERYPRTFLHPPSVELVMATDDMGSRLILADRVTYKPENLGRILHVVNLLLELFGECNVMDADLDSIHQPAITRINWTILPQGRMPWSTLRKELDPIVLKEAKGRQPVLWYRLEAVDAHKPEFVAVGNGGFSGYLIFAFPDKNLFVLECVRYGNATYVFGDDWERLSQMTKAEILDEGLQQDRLIHRLGWRTALDRLFK
jgi:hypothetical protein